MAPVISELERTHTPYVFLHAGQHYDFELSQQFICELGLPEPDIKIHLASRDPATRIGEMILGISRAIAAAEVGAVAVVGDTDAVLASAIAANKQSIEVIHVEAGLRSYDLRMPEEHNRRLTDHLSGVLFAPTRYNRRTLLGERVSGKVFVTGNTIIDSVKQYWPLAQKAESIDVSCERYVLATIHRMENVDSKNVLLEFVRAFTKAPCRVVLPLHPRTKRRLMEFGLWRKLVRNRSQVKILEPVGYFQFLKLMKHSECILTDSGGVQEEATSPLVRKRVVVLRTSTDRPEALKAEFGILAGCKATVILKQLNRILKMNEPPPATSPFGDGQAARRICSLLQAGLWPSVTRKLKRSSTMDISRSTTAHDLSGLLENKHRSRRFIKHIHVLQRWQRLRYCE